MGLTCNHTATGREFIVNELHETHPGISRMKALARSYVRWPNMDNKLENKVKHCGQCQVNRKAPPVAPLHPWEWPQEPWERFHLDYAGPFMGHMFLVIVDAHSKWVDIYIVNQQPVRQQLTSCPLVLLRMDFHELLSLITEVTLLVQSLKTF